MRTIITLFSLILFVNFSFGQSETVTNTAKNKIILKVTNLQKENDALSIDRIISQRDNIYSSKTDFKTGSCEVIADGNVTIDILKKYLQNSGYEIELVSVKPMTEKEFSREELNTYKNIKKK